MLYNFLLLPNSYVKQFSKGAILVNLTFLGRKQHQNKGIIAGSETVKIMYSYGQICIQTPHFSDNLLASKQKWQNAQSFTQPKWENMTFLFKLLSDLRLLNFKAGKWYAYVRFYGA